MTIPYVGITDFTQFNQVEDMSHVFDVSHDRQCPWRRLHVGVMMSRKTLQGIPTRWSNALPPKETIAGIFGLPEAMNCLHYADYDMVDLSANLKKAIEWGGSGINAIQLDMVWPDLTAIEEAVLRSGKKLEVILQVGSRAIEEAGDDPEKVARRVEYYAHFVDFVLLDKSSGKGVPMEAEKLAPFVRTLKQACPNLGIAVAGGLGPTTLNLVRPLVAEFPDLSIDAQGKLRPSGSALDPIDWEMARMYLTRALAMFNAASPRK
jgi:hypothetical protein